MKLFSISDNYINYLRKFDQKVYDNKELIFKNTRKYLGIVLKINKFNYYIPLSSPKTTNYINGNIRKSIIPIIRITSYDELNNKTIFKGTLRLSNMIPVPDSELILYNPLFEKDKNYKILIEKNLDFFQKMKI